MNNTPDSPAQTPDDRTDQGGNYWTLFTPGIWKLLHAVSQNWVREAEKWLVQPMSASIWTTKKQEPAEFVVVNYDVLARPAVAKELRARRWDVAVFDEAHALKNDKATRTKAALGNQQDGTTQSRQAVGCS